MKRMIAYRGVIAGLVVLTATMTAQSQATGSASRFPRELLINSARIVIHAPQVESWKDYETLVSWLAVEVTFLDEGVAHVGAVKVQAVTQVDKAARAVGVYQVKALEIHFLGVPKGQAELLSGAAKSAIESERGVFPLDLVLANLAKHGDGTASMPVAVPPPAIYTADSPTALVILDGDPVLAPIAGTGLGYVVNTDEDLLVDSSSGKNYLLLDGVWLQAAHLKDTWENAATLPEGLSALPAGPRWDAAREAALPSAGAAPAPKVLVSTRPAELIQTGGAPLFREFPDTFLAYVDNTDSDVFMELLTGTYYYLVSGRWFQATSLDGPWEPAAELPDDFAKIPRDGPRGEVLSSVPGTWEARLAVMEAGVPLKAKVDPSKATFQAAYGGAPKFEPIPGTKLSRAVNTEEQVLQIKSGYFACHQGVWFLSSSPEGPWAVAREVPEAIYTIPAGSPAYPVTFVRSYGHQSGKTTFGYTAGYENVYVSGGVVVYGTGQDFPPYLAADASPPIYYPGFSTFGSSAYYDSYDGVFRHAAPGGHEPHNPYQAWGSMVAMPEKENQGHTERLAAPSAASVQANAQSDLYVGPDRHVYGRSDGDWNRVSSGDGEYYAEEDEPDDQEFTHVRDRQMAIDQSLQDNPLPESGLIIDGDLAARQYYYSRQRVRRPGAVGRRARRY